MSNCHFKLAMTGSTKSNQVADDIGIVLIDIVAAGVNMMHIKTASAGATFCSTGSTNLVAVVDRLSYALPVATVLQALSASPMSTILSGHVLDSALTRAVLSSIAYLGRKRVEWISAIRADESYMRSNSAGVGTLGRAMLDFWRLLVKDFAAEITVSISHLCLTPFLVTLWRAKNVLDILAGSVRLAGKLLATMVAYQSSCLSDSINSASPRAMVDVPLICLEPFSTLEASLEHS